MKTEKVIHGSETYGIGEAQVLSVRGERQHQVKVYHPDFGVTEFIPFIQTPGMYRVPRVGDRCFVFCNENWTDYPMAWGHKPSEQLIADLVGARLDNITIIYSSGEDNDSISHTIELDDGDDKGIRIKTHGNNRIIIKDKDQIEILHNSGSFFRIDQNSIELSVQGSSIVMNASGIELISAGGASQKLTGNVEVSSSGGSTVKLTDSITVSAGAGSELEVGSGIQGTAADANSTFDNVSVPHHQHVGNLGFLTQPPIPQP